MRAKDKIEALAKYLEVDASDIEENGDEFEVDGATYLVLTDEEAEKAFRDSIEDVIAEFGIDAFTHSFQDWIIDNALETDWFEDALSEDIQYNVDNLENEELYNELLVHHWVSEDDFIEDEDGNRVLPDDIYDSAKSGLVDELIGDVVDPVEWFKDTYGDDFADIIGRYNLLDIDKIVEEIRFIDGRGNTLSSYDRDELILGDDLYAYRVD